MNRNIIHTLWMAALPLLLASCQQEELPGMSGASDATPLTITVTDGGYASTDKAATRAAENGYSTEFTDGDACGLYIVRGSTVAYDNVKLTVTAGADGSLTWQPDTTLSGGWANEKYFLYYPYQSDMSGKTNAAATDEDGFFAPLVSSWQPAADQSTYADYTASDLMTAQGTATKANGTLSLSFSMTHRMAMAVIEMPKTLYKFTDNTDIPDCTVTSSADFADSDAKPCRMADGTYRCIVNPASTTATRITGSYADGKREFTFTTNGIAGSYKTYKIDGLTPIEKKTTLQMGDYFCKNSDNKWYIIPQEATPDGNVIGIVFYVGRNYKDHSNYSATGIGQAQCHGYAVALTDVHNDDTDRLRWECGPKNEYDKKVGTSFNNADWNGYSNSQKFHEFINKNTGWEMKHFPAAFACETYGNRTTDQNGDPVDGKYDWQKPLAAPSNTCGWFLPTNSQLKHLYDNSSLLSARMDVVRSSVPADCIYRDKIKWFTTSLYWSSTERMTSANAYGVDFGSGGSRFYSNDNGFAVRAVLAF